VLDMVLYHEIGVGEVPCKTGVHFNSNNQ
jgi:hypothetical protein